LRLNKSKTIVYRLGGLANVDNKLLLQIGLSSCTDSFKYLGIWFDRDPKEMEYKNFRHRLENCKNLLRIWKQRDLSLKGKVVVIKALAMSQLIYPLTMLEVPEWVVKEANNLFYDFLWDSKPDKIKRTTMMRKIEDGGIKMINVDAMARALKIKWISKICLENSSKWVNIPDQYFCQIDINDFCCSNFKDMYIPQHLPMFYRQSLIAFNEIRKESYETSDEVLKQLLWGNKDILVDKKPLFFKDWYIGGIKTVMDIMDSDGKFLLPDILCQKYNLSKIDFLNYYSLRQAIPYAWKKIIRQNPLSRCSEPAPSISSEDRIEDLKYVTTNQIYYSVLDINTQDILGAEVYWKEIYNVNFSELKKYFYLPYSCTRETKIQSLQFKILHNIYPTRLKLSHWKIKDSPQCIYCPHVDNITHHFTDCDKMVIFWNSFMTWWSYICQYCQINENREIILGILGSRCHALQLNYIIAQAKWFIFRCKYLEVDLSCQSLS